MSWLGKDKETEHRHFQEELSAYLDGELRPGEREAVEQHLSTCPSCRWNLETLRQTVQWTSELPTVRVPRTFMIPVPAQPARATRRWRLVPLLQGATALVALLLFFAVAGDVMLTGFQPFGTRGAEPRMLSAESTMPAEAEAMDTVVVETVVVEKEVEGLAAQEAPAAEASEAAPESAKMLQVAPEEAATVTAIAEMRATMAPPGMGGGEGTEAAAPAPAGDTRAAETAAPLAAPAVPPTLTALPTLAPEPTVMAMPPPSAEVAVGEGLPAPGAVEETEREYGYGARSALVNWVRWGEYVLGVLLIVLVGTMIGAMVWRRNRR